MIHGPYNIMSKGLVWGKQYTEASSEMHTKHKKFKGRINSGDLNINGGMGGVFLGLRRQKPGL